MAVSWQPRETDSLKDAALCSRFDRIRATLIHFRRGKYTVQSKQCRQRRQGEEKPGLGVFWQPAVDYRGFLQVGEVIPNTHRLLR